MMVTSRWSCAVVILLGLAAPGSAATDQAVELAGDTIAQEYDELRQHAEALDTSLGKLCRQAKQSDLADTQHRFAEVVDAWSRVETIRFGPVTEKNRLERILYWPDRKGLGLKQVQAALANQDATAADIKTLPDKSVAMQGLGALEFVLYGTGSEELAAGKPDNYRCRYGQAIAANIFAISRELAQNWPAFARQWANPGPDNALFRNDGESFAELVNVFIEGIEMIRDIRLKGFLGFDTKGDKPRQAIYWRSQLTTQSLSADMNGLRVLYETSGLGKTLTGENAYIADAIGAILRKASTSLGKDTGPIAETLADPAKRKSLEGFRGSVAALRDLVGTQLTTALGLSAGFSSLDGD